MEAAGGLWAACSQGHAVNQVYAVSQGNAVYAVYQVNQVLWGNRAGAVYQAL